MLGWWITKCANNRLQSVLGVGLHKAWQNRLQSALGITKCGWVDYKLRQGLQSVAGLKSELVQMSACNKRPHILKQTCSRKMHI